jgi:hypothetical protein
LGGKEWVKEGLEEGFHRLHPFRGSLLPTAEIQTHHGAKEGHSTLDQGNVVSVGPVSNRARDLRIRSPEERGLRKGNGEAKRRREVVEALKEGGGLLDVC